MSAVNKAFFPGSFNKLFSPNERNKLIVSAYRMCGFAILTVILVGLGSYLLSNAFYFGSRSWVAPTVVSRTDERVIRLYAQLEQQSAARDNLARERREMAERLAHEERTLATEEGFQQSCLMAVKTELAANTAELSELRRLLTQFSETKGQILRSNQAYSGLSRQRLSELLKARLIDQDGLVSANFQLAQIAHANLSLTEKKVDLDARITSLDRKVASLGVAAEPISPRDLGRPHDLSYEVLQIRHELERSVAESERARAARDMLVENVKAADATLARYDSLIQSIHEDPYLTAVEHNLTVAFAPYDNLDRMPSGAPVYGCRLWFVWCKKIGRVREALGGEVIGKHPLRNQELRGRMIELELEGPAWAERPVLHVGRAPLLL